jgi:VIT1/CCC1 family predicted Fe2+/Mn2+ transporter
MSDPRDHHDHPHPRGGIERWHRAAHGAALRNFVLGTSDGLVTVLAFVAGVSASFSKSSLVLAAGVVEMFAGAFSMGLGAFLGARAERDLYAREREREEREVRDVPHLEREELREIYRKKGFDGPPLERVVETLTATPERWVDVMMSEELGLSPIAGSPWAAGLVVGLSYVVAAAIPLAAYVVLDASHALAVSAALTSCALLGVGGWKARYTQQPLVRGALETLAMGLTGAVVCYGIGQLGRRLTGNG